jgi:sterol desaturase/sphingolipid hydroxylase (fatty acid hydroxylase superfamily)
MPNYIAFAVPVFFSMIGVEVWLAARKRRKVYRFADAVADLSAGITQQTLLIFQKAALVFVYLWGYEHRVITLSSSSVAVWVAAFLLVDFVYYWWHRLSHEVNFLWAAHVIHHSSEDYNLAVALRQGVFTPWTISPFHLPLALLGVPPVVMLAADSFNTLYQFWIHTELVGKLGVLEKVMNTPSHHRVHHGINPRYLDKNYGGILIIWDALFGTLEPETEPVVYGLVKPLRSYNPLWGQLHRYVELAQISWRSKHALDRLKVWLMPPPWLPRDLDQYPPPPEVSPERFQKYDPREPLGLQIFVLVQLVTVIVTVTALMFEEDSVAMPLAGAVATLVMAALTAWGGLAEGKSWAVPLEIARLLGSALVLGAFAHMVLPATAALALSALGGAFALGCAVWVARYRPTFQTATA